MQSSDMEAAPSPSILDTPSLTTPNIVSSNIYMKNDFDASQNEYANELDSSNVSASSSVNSTISSSVNSNELAMTQPTVDMAVSKIEDSLKKSLSETRKPTPSPFEKFATGSIPVSRPAYTVQNDDGTITEIPSTADVVLVLESLTNGQISKLPEKSDDNEIKDPGQQTNTLDIGENSRYETLTAVNSAATPSPKKIFLLRSQSITDSAGSNSTNSNLNGNLSNNNHTSSFARKLNDISSLTLSNGFDPESLTIDSMGNQVERETTLTTLTELSNANLNNDNTFKVIENGNEPIYNEQLRTETNGFHSNSISKQQQQIAISTNKRPFSQNPQISSNLSMPKSMTIGIPVSTLPNEVSSSDQLTHTKRQKVSSFSTGSRNSATTNTNNFVIGSSQSSNSNIGTDDQRKKQIRDSNREAARRCRERRRQYIEQLEGNLEQTKNQLKQVTEKLSRVERENLQLRTLISESKFGHGGARLPTTEQRIDFASIVAASGIEPNPDSNHQGDNGSMSRSFINRNNL